MFKYVFLHTIKTAKSYRQYLDFSFLGAKSPQRELSLSWSFRSAEYSLPRSEYSKCKLSLLGTFAPRSECSKNFRSVELSQCSRPRSHALTPFRLDAPVYRHVNTSSAVPTLSSRRHCMPSSIRVQTSLDMGITFPLVPTEMVFRNQYALHWRDTKSALRNSNAASWHTSSFPLRACILIEPVVPALSIIVGPDGLKCRPTAGWPQMAALCPPTFHQRYQTPVTVVVVAGITSRRCLKANGMCSTGNRGRAIRRQTSCYVVAITANR